MYKLKFSKKTIGIGSIIVALIPFYFLANYIVLTALRYKLNQNPDYKISIGSVYINPFIGSYHINSIIVREAEYPKSVYFSVTTVDLKIQWSALIFHGRLVGKIILNEPHLNFVKHLQQKEGAMSIYQQWQVFTKGIFPLGLNAIEVNNGDIAYTYLDDNHKPITSKASNIYVELVNGSCVVSCKDLGAQLAISAQLENQGQLYSIIDFDPSSKLPRALIQTKIEYLDLKDYRPMISEKTNLKLKQGFGDFYIYLDIQKNSINGYLKVFLQKVDIDAKYPNVFNKLKANLAQGLVNFFKNEETHETATKTPIKGKVDVPETSLWDVVNTGLRHAFIEALSHS